MTARRLRSRWAGLALLVSVGAGLVAGLVPGHHDVPADYDTASLEAAAATPPGDRMRAAIDGVQETGFYIGPELRGELTDTEVASIERTLATAPVPVHLVWWEDTSDAGYRSEYAAIDQLRVGVHEDGYYAILSPGRVPMLAGLGYEDPFVEADGTGRPGPALQRYVDELVTVPPERYDDGDGGGSDYWGGVGGGFAAGLLFAGLGYLGLLMVIGIIGVFVRRPRATG